MCTLERHSPTLSRPETHPTIFAPVSLLIFQFILGVLSVQSISDRSSQTPLLLFYKSSHFIKYALFLFYHAIQLMKLHSLVPLLDFCSNFSHISGDKANVSYLHLNSLAVSSIRFTISDSGFSLPHLAPVPSPDK